MSTLNGSRELDGSADLDVDWLDAGWDHLLATWLDDARRAGVVDPTAMVLGTVEAGSPVTRTVLCRNIDAAGVTFCTSSYSSKAKAIDATPRGSVTFPWYALGRQVQVRGAVRRVSDELADHYWRRRQRASQLGVWASRQSQSVASRRSQLERLEDVRAQFSDTEHIPRPDHWCGYVVAADVVEFWQGRQNRLDNRIIVCNSLVERLQC